jgi:hypothetical protein
MNTRPLLSAGTLSFAALALSSTVGKAAIAYASVDVADFKPTSGDVAFGFPTSNGNDGNVSTFNHADNTNPAPNNPYWEVDLQGAFNLTQIVVTDRAGCCSPNRLNGSTISLIGAGGALLGTESIGGIVDGTFGSVFSFNNGGVGYSGVERVRIDGSQQYFQFAEFDAFSLQPKNWALGAVAGHYNAGGSLVASWPSLPAGNITDGNFNSISHPQDQASSGYYAQIDLGQSIYIDSITMTGRLDGCCPERLEGYQLQFLDAAGGLLHTMNHPGSTTPTETIDVIGSFGGLGPQARFVRVVNANGANYGPQIGELQVFGVVPEPSATILLGLGLCGLLRRRRSK